VHSHALLPLWLDADGQSDRPPPHKLIDRGIAGPEWSVESHLAIDGCQRHRGFRSFPGRARRLFSKAAGSRLARAMNEEFAEIRRPSSRHASLPSPSCRRDDHGRKRQDRWRMRWTSRARWRLQRHSRVATIWATPRFGHWFAEMDRAWLDALRASSAVAWDDQIRFGHQRRDPRIHVRLDTDGTEQLVLSGAKHALRSKVRRSSIRMAAGRSLRRLADSASWSRCSGSAPIGRYGAVERCWRALELLLRLDGF